MNAARPLVVLAAAAATVATVALLGGVSPVLGLLLVLPVAGLAATRFATAGPRAVDGGWAAGAPWGPAPRVVRPPARRAAVVAALSRVEARQLATDPWFAGVGGGFALLAVVLFTVVWREGNGGAWAETLALLPWLVHPLAGMAVLAAHRATTRARRDGVEELLDACPATATTRTLAGLATGWVAVLAVGAQLALQVGGSVALSPDLHGPVPARTAALVVGSLVLGAGAVALGVALGRWARAALVPVVAVVVVGVLSLRLATTGDPGWNRWSVLSTFGPQVDSPLLLDVAPLVGWAAWLAALTGLVGVLAVARHRRDGRVLLAAVLTGVLAVVAGAAAMRPVDAGAAARLADQLARPEAHQRCASSADGGTRVCTYAGYDELRRRVLAAVAPVLAARPAGAPALTLRQGPGLSVDEVPPRVAAHLAGGLPSPAPAELALDDAASSYALRVDRLLAALRATGLPVVPDPGRRPVVVAGEARGVLALWLAARGLPTAEATRLASADDVGAGDAFGRGYAWPDGCATAPVVWSAQDLAAARRVLALPADQVGGVVRTGWDRWIDPGTGTDALLAALGVPPVGPVDDVTTREVRSC